MYFTLSILIVGVIAFIMWFSSKKPTGVGDWSKDQAVLPWTEIRRDSLHIHNIRHCKYRAAKDYDVEHFDRIIALSDIETVDFIVEPFRGQIGIAHTFVSFGLKDGSYLSVSIEVRKQKGEKYSAWKGLFRQFEIMYVIADERDVIKLRANFRKDDVFLYPIKATSENIQKMFLSMIKRMNKLHTAPEFYNTITNTCTTELADHINTVTKKRVPYHWRLFIPTLVDRYAYDLGLIDNKEPFEVVKQKALINEKAYMAHNSQDYSKKIRGL